MAEDLGQPRTEAPSPRRREESRQEGQVALSHDASAALLLLAGVGTLWYAGQSVGAALLGALRSGLAFHAPADWVPAHAIVSMRWLAGQTGHAVGLIVALLFVVALATGVLQAGVRVTLSPLVANWERLSPAHGWSRLMSLDGAARGISVTLKLAIVSAVLAWFLSDRGRLLAILEHSSLGQCVAAGWWLALQTAAVIAGAFLAIGAADYVYQRIRHEQRLKMTPEELKREHREDEGDPHVRARIRKLQRAVAERKMVHEVPKATVVLTNPTHIAVALRYDRSTMAAPRVIAKGDGLIARRIVEVARQHGVPVVERKPIARFLYRSVRIGGEVPVELYHALAEILAYVYRLRRS